jgi:hypothetical protein
LPDADEAVAYRLFLALKVLESGHSAEALMKALDFKRTPLDAKKYNPDQPRVPAGNGRAMDIGRQWVGQRLARPIATK